MFLRFFTAARPGFLRKKPSRRRIRAAAGFTLVQVAVATAVVSVAGLTGIQSLILMNRRAASARLMTYARALVEQNLNTALSIPYTNVITPTILTTTTSTPAATTVPLCYLRNGTTAFLNAKLWRIVTVESTSPPIRRVTFTIAYNYAALPKTFTAPDSQTYTGGYTATTLRTTD